VIGMREKLGERERVREREGAMGSARE